MAEKYHILILGSGGREHALAWKIAQSPLLGSLHIAPGNGGTTTLGKQVELDINNFDLIGNYCVENQISIIVVGPEDPLVNGISDFFASNQTLAHIFVFGPNQFAAQLEGSKDFSKQFMQKHQIPTAKYKTFVRGEEDLACQFLDIMQAPFVLKADGLAAGKGVLIVKDKTEAQANIREMLGGQFGKASEKLVIEEFLDGIEVSYFAMCDGENYILLPEAKDYKRIGEGDTGLNTGGMGAVSPVPFANSTFTQKVIDHIVEPTINGLKTDGINYVGFLFFGLIKVNNEPMVIEYNCRMGDPETEVVIPRLESDLLEAIIAAKNKTLNNYHIAINAQTCTTVIAVSGGYPEAYEKGKTIHFNSEINNGILFHAGTKKEGNTIQSNGGRVLASTGFGDTIKDALQMSYQNLSKVSYDKMYFRNDIGKDLINYQNEQI